MCGNSLSNKCIATIFPTGFAHFLSVSHFGNPSVQFSSVAQSCPTLFDPMNRSMPGLPVHHQLPEFTQTHVHQVSDVIQPSHPLSSPSPPAPNPSQHQSPFQWVTSWGGQSTGVSALTSFLPKKSQGRSPLEWTGWISLQSKGLSRAFSNTTVQKHWWSVIDDLWCYHCKKDYDLLKAQMIEVFSNKVFLN